jgi:hypothetical protein
MAAKKNKTNIAKMGILKHGNERKKKKGRMRRKRRATSRKSRRRT